MTKHNKQVFATDGVLERVWYDSNTNGEFELEATDRDVTITGTETAFGDTGFDELALAYWHDFSDTIYTQFDFSCENAGTRDIDPVFNDGNSYLNNNCLEKGDLLVIPSFTTPVDDKDALGKGEAADQNYGETQTMALDTLNSAGIYEIMKISVEDYTMTRWVQHLGGDTVRFFYSWSDTLSWRLHCTHERYTQRLRSGRVKPKKPQSSLDRSNPV